VNSASFEVEIQSECAFEGKDAFGNTVEILSLHRNKRRGWIHHYFLFFCMARA